MACLEALALMKKLGLEPRRTIRVAFWVNEENGGRGGQSYRAFVGEDIKNHVAAIEMDGGAEAPRGFGAGVDRDRPTTGRARTGGRRGRDDPDQHRCELPVRAAALAADHPGLSRLSLWGEDGFCPQVDVPSRPSGRVWSA